MASTLADALKGMVTSSMFSPSGILPTDTFRMAGSTYHPSAEEAGFPFRLTLHRSAHSRASTAFSTVTSLRIKNLSVRVWAGASACTSPALTQGCA